MADQTGHRRRLRGSGHGHAALAAIAALAVGGSLAGVASAASKSPVNTAHNSKLNATVVVSASGMTLYRLTGETSKHLLCSSSACLKFWPPLTVASAHTKLAAGKGVTGKLAVLKRGKTFQVTLAGKPLYRFSGDSAKGDANGEGVKSFGGTWWAVNGSGGNVSTTTNTTSSSTTTTSSAGGYGY